MFALSRVQGSASPAEEGRGALSEGRRRHCREAQQAWPDLLLLLELPELRLHELVTPARRAPVPELRQTSRNGSAQYGEVHRMRLEGLCRHERLAGTGQSIRVIEPSNVESKGGLRFDSA